MDPNGWHRVDPLDVPAEGRVRSVTVDGRTVALARCGARLGALGNKYGIAVKHLLLDSHSLGKIGKEQLAADFPVWQTSLHNPDWAAYAELCGATGIRVDERHQPGAAMARLFAAGGLPLLHVEQDAELL